MNYLKSGIRNHENMGIKLLIDSIFITVISLAVITLFRQLSENYQFVGIFWSLLLNQDYWSAWIFLVLLITAFIPKKPRLVLSIVDILGRRPVATAIIVFISLCAGTLLVYHNHPLSMDEYSMQFQSEVFASGHLTGNFPPIFIDWLIPDTYQNHFLIASPESGDVISAYLPGFALILTPFTFLGIPWACNPAISALTLLVLHKLARETLQSNEAAGWTVMFLLASPVFTINAISYFSMPAHLLLNMSFALLLLQPTTGKSFIAGLVGGIAMVLHNPLPHALFAFPWIAWMLYRREFRLVGALVLGYLPPLIGLGAGWIVLASSLRSSASLGSDVNATGATAGSSLLAWLAIVKNTVTFPGLGVLLMRLGGTIKLWLWAFPGLVLLAIIGFRAHREKTVFQLFLASAILTYFGFFLIPVSQGLGWGYRYFHSAWGVLPILAAAAVISVPDRTQPSTRFISVVGYLALSSFIIANIFQAYQVGTYINRHLNQIPNFETKEPTITFIERSFGYYSIDLIRNQPDLRNTHVMMLSKGSEKNLEFVGEIDKLATKVQSGSWGETWKINCHINNNKPFCN